MQKKIFILLLLSFFSFSCSKLFFQRKIKNEEFVKKEETAKDFNAFYFKFCNEEYFYKKEIEEFFNCSLPEFGEIFGTKGMGNWIRGEPFYRTENV